jgi:hypothetical protein
MSKASIIGLLVLFNKASASFQCNDEYLYNYQSDICEVFVAKQCSSIWGWVNAEIQEKKQTCFEECDACRYKELPQNFDYDCNKDYIYNYNNNNICEVSNCAFDIELDPWMKSQQQERDYCKALCYACSTETTTTTEPITTTEAITSTTEVVTSTTELVTSTTVEPVCGSCGLGQCVHKNDGSCFDKPASGCYAGTYECTSTTSTPVQTTSSGCGVNNCAVGTCVHDRDGTCYAKPTHPAYNGGCYSGTTECQ